MRVRRCVRPNVAITLDESEPKAIEQGLELIEFRKMIKSDDVVVITPNWVGEEDPENGRIVGPDSLRKLIQLVKSCSPKRVVVATGPGQEDVEGLMERVGFKAVIEEEQVEFINLNKGPFTMIEINHNSPTKLCLNKIYDEMTFLISFTQLKFHEEATMSGALKNIAMGWPAGDEQGYPKKDLGIHGDLHGFMTAILDKFTIDLSIVSASPAMVGTGPNNGVSRHTGLVLCGTDPVATDVVGLRLLGFKPQAAHYIYKIIKNGWGCGLIDLKQGSGIQFKGMELTKAEEHFSKVAYNKAFKLD